MILRSLLRLRCLLSSIVCFVTCCCCLLSLISVTFYLWWFFSNFFLSVHFLLDDFAKLPSLDTSPPFYYCPFRFLSVSNLFLMICIWFWTMDLKRRAIPSMEPLKSLPSAIQCCQSRTRHRSIISPARRILPPAGAFPLRKPLTMPLPLLTHWMHCFSQVFSLNCLTSSISPLKSSGKTRYTWSK